MSGKHTRGPWALEGMTGRNPIMTGGRLHRVCNDEYLVAFIPECGDDVSEADEYKANARLIAAAPETYEALKSLLAAIEQALPWMAGSEHFDDARSAIAKAERPA